MGYNGLRIGLVGVLTILKNISQWEGLSHILWKKTCLKPPASGVYMFLSCNVVNPMPAKPATQ